MKTRTTILACAFMTAAVAAAACGGGDLPSDTTSSSSSSSGASSTSSSTSSGGGGGGAPDCYAAPKTHVEIINACTDAQKIDVSPVLPLLQPDGGLPPLP